MKRINRSGFLAFIFSFIPGLVEMYFGLFKQGISLLAVFMLTTLFLDLRGYFLVFTAIVWFYGFFHARGLAHLNAEELNEVNDVYIWQELFGENFFAIPDAKARKIFAFILIFLGTIILWNSGLKAFMEYAPGWMESRFCPILDIIPQIAISVLIIVVGVKLIAGKKKGGDDVE